MAITVDGVPVSGSTGNNTYSRNRYGAYRRRRVKGVNPNSTRQAEARMRLTVAISRWWNVLSDAQRIAWNNWAVATPWLNKAGQTVHLTGQAAYVRAFCANAASNFNAAAVTIEDPPPENNTGNIFANGLGVTLDATPGAEQMTVIMLAAASPVNIAAVATGRWIVRLSPGYSAGHAFAGSRFTQIGDAGAPPAWAAGTLTVTINTAAITQMPYLPSIGSKVWATVRGIGPNATDRRVTEEFLVGPTVVVDGA